MQLTFILQYMYSLQDILTDIMISLLKFVQNCHLLFLSLRLHSLHNGAADGLLNPPCSHLIGIEEQKLKKYIFLHLWMCLFIYSLLHIFIGLYLVIHLSLYQFYKFIFLHSNVCVSVGMHVCICVCVYLSVRISTSLFINMVIYFSSISIYQSIYIKY